MFPIQGLLPPDQAGLATGAFLLSGPFGVRGGAPVSGSGGDAPRALRQQGRPPPTPAAAGMVAPRWRAATPARLARTVAVSRGASPRPRSPGHGSRRAARRCSSPLCPGRTPGRWRRPAASPASDGLPRLEPGALQHRQQRQGVLRLVAQRRQEARATPKTPRAPPPAANMPGVEYRQHKGLKNRPDTSLPHMGRDQRRRRCGVTICVPYVAAAVVAFGTKQVDGAYTTRHPRLITSAYCQTSNRAASKPFARRPAGRIRS